METYAVGGRVYQRYVAYWKDVDEGTCIAQLEKEIPDLEHQASRIGSIVEYTNMPTPKDPKIKTEAEAIVDRLDRARAELKLQKGDARSDRTARRDGVSSGQLC